MEKRSYIEPAVEPLVFNLAALMAGSVDKVDSEELDSEISGGNEPARAKESTQWNLWGEE